MYFLFELLITNLLIIFKTYLFIYFYLLIFHFNIIINLENCLLKKILLSMINLKI